MPEVTCPVCLEPAQDETPQGFDGRVVNCVSVCNAKFRISGSMLAVLRSEPSNTKARRYLSHKIAAFAAKGGSLPDVSNDLIKEARENPSFPTPLEQFQNFMLVVGESVLTVGEFVDIKDLYKFAARVGCQTWESIVTLGRYAQAGGLFSGDHLDSLYLTLSGWTYIDELRKGREQDSTLAFLAMDYGNKEVKKFVVDNFVAAAGELNFRVEKLDDNPEAGVLDNRMQLMIKRSRFLIADVTFPNNGAYWEAGYAYGLGKPVIYTCRQAEAKKLGKSEGKHFDVDHHQAVHWDPDDPKKARDDLKTIVENTILKP